MEMNDFDKWLKNKIDQEDLDHVPKGWEQIKAALQNEDDTNKPSGKFGLLALPIFNKYVGIAAAVVLSLGAVYLFNNNKIDTPNTPVQQPIVNNTEKFNNQVEKSHAPTLIADNSNNAPQTNIVAQNNVAHKNINTNNNKSNISSFDKTSTLNKNNNLVKNINDVIAGNNGEITRNDNEKVAVKENTKSSTNEINSNAEFRYHTNKPKMNDDGPNYYASHDREKSTLINNIGIGGGVNYGNFNTGYAVALSAQKDIARNVFIEGTIGMAINNNTTQPIVGMNNSGDILARPAPGKTFVNSPAITNNTPQLLYVQFNPSIGYNFEDKLTFSVGSDLQHIVNKKDEKIVTYNSKTNESELLPSLDLGITTKTEISLSKNIKTGLILRNGLNNIFQSQSDLKFVNRRYIQVQFRYLLNFKKKSTSSRF